MTPGLVLLARTGSSRLPAKSLLDVCGQPVLAHQVARLKLSRRPRCFVLATTSLPEDEALCAVAAAHGFGTFRGSPTDVLRRLGDAADHFGIDFLVVVGGDDVFCEGEFVDAVINEHERTRADFVTVACSPFGTAPFGVGADALRRVLSLRSDDASDGWERFFTETGLFKTAIVEPSDPLLRHPEIRLDVDYAEDYHLVKAIYERLYDGQVPSLRRVMRLLVEEEPALTQINRAAREKCLKNRAAAWPPLRLKPTL